MRRIHPTAVVDPAAVLHEDVDVGPHCVVGPHVQVGRATVLRSHVVLDGHTVVGEGNTIHPGAVLGGPPQDLKYAGEPTRLVVGDRNQIREHVTFHCGTPKGGGVTRVGNDCMFMVGCHVAHDVTVGNNVIMANHVLLAGHSTVQDRAVLNGAAACHHFTTIGRLAYVGGLSRITHDVAPFTIAEGSPVAVRGANIVGMRRAGFPPDSISKIARAVRRIFVSEDETVRAAMEAVEREWGGDPLLAELIAFVRASERGRHGRAQEHRAGDPPRPPPPASA